MANNNFPTGPVSETEFDDAPQQAQPATPAQAAAPAQLQGSFPTGPVPENEFDDAQPAQGAQPSGTPSILDEAQNWKMENFGNTSFHAILGAIKGAADTGHVTAAAANWAANKITGGAVPQVVQFETPEALKPKNLAENIGTAGEGIAEFFLGDAALMKGLSAAQKFQKAAKLMEIIQESPRLAAALHIGAHAMSMGSVGAAQAVEGQVKAGQPVDIPAAIQAGIMTGGTGGALESAGAIGRMAASPYLRGAARLAEMGGGAAVAGGGLKEAATPQQPGESPAEAQQRQITGGIQGVMGLKGIKESVSPEAGASEVERQATAGTQTPAKVTARGTEAVARMTQEPEAEAVQQYARGLRAADVSKAKTFGDIVDALDTKVTANTAMVDKALASRGMDKARLTRDQMETTVPVEGGVDRKVNPVADALNQMRDFYDKTNATPDAARIEGLQNRMRNQGLTLKEINDIAREHGKQLSGFNASGELASGLTKQAAENTRASVKELVRDFAPETEPTDRETSDLIATRERFEELQKAARKTELSLEGAGLLRRTLRKAGAGALVGGMAGGAKGAAEGAIGEYVLNSMFPSGKVDALKLQKQLPKLLTDFNAMSKLPPVQQAQKLTSVLGELHGPKAPSQLAQATGTPKGVGFVTSEVSKTVAAGADAFNAEHNRPAIDATTKEHNPEFAARVADASDTLKHNPNDPEVQASYGAMKRDIKDQWDYAAQKMGIKFEPWETSFDYKKSFSELGKEKAQPYANSKEMMDDVKNNHHLYFFQGGEMAKDHPLAEIDPKTGYSYNDMLRAVHDLFGHAAHGFQFGPKGEENAYLVHRQMFSPEAIPALTTETRAQNSWFNYGSHLRNAEGKVPAKGEPGYVPTSERPFAENKAALLPKEFQEAQAAPAPSAADYPSFDYTAHPDQFFMFASPEEQAAGFEPGKWNVPEHIKTIAGAIASQDAGALNPHTGEPDPAGRGLHGVEVFPEARKRYAERPTDRDVAAFGQENAQLFSKHPELRIGWDHDPKNHPNEPWELNIGAAGTPAGAREVGTRLDQRAAFDIDKGVDVPLGGKNQKTEFSDYPLEQRLADLKKAPLTTAEATKSVSNLLKDKFGTTNEPLGAGFILKSGDMVPLRGEHDQMLNQVLGGPIDKYVAGRRVGFINDEGAIRTRYTPNTHKGNLLTFSVPESGVTEDQVAQMRRAVGAMGRNGNVAMEIARHGGLYTEKDFARPSDIDDMLRQIHAHPEQQEPNILTEERQSALKEPYKIEVENPDGTTRIETVPGFSSKNAIATAQKKFPEASGWRLESFGERAPSTEYSVPTGKPLTMPTDYSGDLSPERTFNHELGHAMIGVKEGLTNEGMIRHTHPDAGRNTRAGVSWSGEGLYRAGQIKHEMVPNLIRTFMGGIAQDELRGIPRDENHNFDITRASSDGQQALKILRNAGFDAGRALDIMSQAIDENKAYLSHPAVSGIIKDNAMVREPDLSRQYHFSPERLNNIHAEAQRRVNAEATAEPDYRTAHGEGQPGYGAAVAGGQAEGAPGVGQGVSPEKEITPSNLSFKHENFGVDQRVHKITAQGELGEELGHISLEFPKNAKRKGDFSARVAMVAVDEPGKGLGQKLYLQAAQEAQKQGARYLVSDVAHSVSPGAVRVWDKLIEKGYPVEKLGEKNYRMDLSQKITPGVSVSSEKEIKTSEIASPEMQKKVADTPWTDDKITGYRRLRLPGIGSISYSGEPGDENARIRGSYIQDDYKNQGIGKELYKSAIDDAKTRGVKIFQSDTVVSPEAQRVWESLIRSGEYPITKVATKNFNADEFASAAEAARAGRGGVEYRVDLTKPITTAEVSVPPRNSINPKIDKIIEDAGGIPGGIQKGAPEEDIPDYAMFHDPENGSSLMLPMGEVTPLAIREHLAQNRAKFAAAAERARLNAPVVTPEVAARRPRGSSVGLMDNPLEVKGTGETGNITTTDVAKELNKFTTNKIGSLKLGEAKPEAMVKRAKSLAEDEAKYQLAQDNTGEAWYTKDMAEHDDRLREIRPELADPNKLSLFKMVEVVLSSGQKPYANLKGALKAWDYYHETGSFPTHNPDTEKSWGPRGIKAYGSAINSINQLIYEKGEQGASEWLLSEHPIKELHERMTPTQSRVHGKATDLQPGAMILGAKRGPFALNLHGREAAFTADMWVSRTWNRWMGTTEVNPDGEITTDSPRNQTERKLMKQSFQETADKLGLTTSALQAVLWYYEQALYDVHGSAKESWSFSDAAKRVADEDKQSSAFNPEEMEEK